MRERSRARIGRDVDEEIAMPGARKHVAHTHARERLGLLCHQDVERAGDLVGIRRHDERDVTAFAKALALGAVAPARRRRALDLIELGPGRMQIGDVGAARIQSDRQREHRMGLRARGLGHLRQIDQVEAVLRGIAQPGANLAP